MQTSRPSGTNFWPKFEILTILGLYSHICAPIGRAKFYIYRGNVSPMRGEKPIFGPLSKNTTGMAALCAGLPVMRNQRFPHMGTEIFFTKALQNRHKIIVDFHTN